MQIDKNGSGSPAPIPLYKNAIPSNSDYKAVFREFIFYAVSFIMKRRSSIVRRSGSLTAHIYLISEKVCTFSTLAILQKLYFCNWVQAVFSTGCIRSHVPNGDGIGYQKLTEIVYFNLHGAGTREL